MKLDSAIKFGAGRYRQGADVLDTCGEEISRLGSKVFLLAGRRAFAAVEERLLASLRNSNIPYELMLYSGPCSHEAAKEIAQKCSDTGCDVLCGIGGGVIMDLNKAAGEYAGVRIINMPTNMATCAGATTMSVMYTPEGAYGGNWRYEHDIDAILVDTQVMAKQPGRYVAAGVLDAMAKKIEIMNGKPELTLENTGYELYCAYQMARDTYQILEQYGAQAVADTEKGEVTNAIESVAFVNIALTGILSNITKSFGQAALAHYMYYAVRTHFFKEAAHILHGEIVAVGLFIQLHYNQLDSKREQLKAMMEKLGMPLTLRDCGIEPTRSSLKVLEDFLAKTVFVADTEDSHRLLHEGVLLLQN